jgi:hypothetical protein
MNHTETALQLATAGATLADIQKKLTTDGASKADALAALDNVLTYYKTLANFNPEVEMGRAYSRLNLIFLNGVKVQDFKTAIAAQKELNRLLGLYGKNNQPTPAQPPIYDIDELLSLPEPRPEPEDRGASGEEGGGN